MMVDQTQVHAGEIEVGGLRNIELNKSFNLRMKQQRTSRFAAYTISLKVEPQGEVGACRYACGQSVCV